MKRDVSVQRFQDMAAKGAFGFFAVKENVCDLWVRGKERGEIVRAFVFDGGIEAPFPVAGFQNIPQRDAARGHGGKAPVVCCVRRNVEDMAQDRPERVMRMGVILLCVQGGFARHAA